MKSSYSMIHNNFAMGWIMGIMLMVFSLMISMKMASSTAKTSVSIPAMESLWMLVPALILISLSIPTLLNLYESDRQTAASSMSLKTLGMQWYWSYEVVDYYHSNDDNSINSYMDTSNTDRLDYLSSEQELHLPGNTEITNLISASDVMHCWAIPNMVLKVDAIPGRVNAVSMLFESLDEMGKMYGQCSELCGANHSFMPISVVVS